MAHSSEAYAAHQEQQQIAQDVAHDALVALWNLVELCDEVFVKPKENDDLAAARAALKKAGWL